MTYQSLVFSLLKFQITQLKILGYLSRYALVDQIWDGQFIKLTNVNIGKVEIFRFHQLIFKWLQVSYKVVAAISLVEGFVNLRLLTRNRPNVFFKA